MICRCSFAALVVDACEATLAYTPHFHLESNIPTASLTTNSLAFHGERKQHVPQHQRNPPPSATNHLPYPLRLGCRRRGGGTFLASAHDNGTKLWIFAILDFFDGITELLILFYYFEGFATIIILCKIVRSILRLRRGMGSSRREGEIGGYCGSEFFHGADSLEEEASTLDSCLREGRLAGLLWRSANGQKHRSEGF